MRRQRKTRIVATLGPASGSVNRVRALFDAGVDCFRFNMSHLSHAEVAAWHRYVRDLEKEVGRPVATLVDLQGPKLRLGTFREGSVELEEGRTFVLDNLDSPGDRSRACLPHEEIFPLMKQGTAILIDDGRVELEVAEVDAHFVKTTVTRGGPVSDRKGVNLPDLVLPVEAITEKDRADLEFCLGLGFDWVALSFVQKSEDLAEARAAIDGRANLLAKIEKPSALEDVEAIVEAADGIMIARGDLGVEMPVEQLPGIQKNLTRLARNAGKPVIVATQMLESMIDSRTPTRAEVSDIATAMHDGADAVMLSAETAIGAWPVEVVAMMNDVAEQVESEAIYEANIDAMRQIPERTEPDAISAAAHQVAETLGVAAIVSYTTSGSTGLRAARERPHVPILALTPSLDTARRLSISWGIHCVHTEDARDFDDMVHRACHIALRDGFANEGDAIVITAGVPFGTPGATNVLRIAHTEAGHQEPAATS